MLLTPSPLSQTVTLSRTPSSVTYFMDGPFYGVLGGFIQGHFVYGLKIPPQK